MSLGKSIQEVQLIISPNEFKEWVAFDRLEPFGEERADLRSAMITTQISNAFRGKGVRKFKLEDFMPKFEQEIKVQTPDQMFRVLMAFTRVTGGKVIGKKK